MSPGFGLLFMVACAVFYWRLGEQEYSSGILLAGVSIALWLGARYFLGLGALGCILVQAGLFAVLTGWNMVKGRTRK